MNEQTEQIATVRLVDERIAPVKQLAGFDKHHRVPTKCSDSDHRFLAELAEPELDSDLQEVFSMLRKSFGLKRKEISVDGPADGSGIIATPFFNYEIHVAQCEDDPSKLKWRRFITEISEPARVFTEPFEEVFGEQFSALEISTVEPLDLESIVDHIEDAELETVKVNYDKDLTWCEIKIADSITSVKLSDRSISVISRREVAPQQLLQAFLEIQQQFIATLNLSGFPFLAGSD